MEDNEKTNIEEQETTQEGPVEIETPQAPLDNDVTENSLENQLTEQKDKFLRLFAEFDKLRSRENSML